MKFKLNNLGRVTAWGLLAATACAGTKLTDVGDIDGGGAAGSGGATGNSAGKTGSAGKGGKAGSGSGGTPGTAGTGDVSIGGTGDVSIGGHDDPYVPIEGGYGGEAPGLVCEACELVADTPDIRGIWATTDRLYWIEYGSFDDLGNYEENGRLMSLEFDAVEPTVITNGLQGPVQLGVTDDYAYVIEERSQSVEGELELTSVKLDGGEIQVVQALPPPTDRDPPLINWFGRNFAAVGGSIFWNVNGVVNTMVEGTPPLRELDMSLTGTLVLVADDTQLYVQDTFGIQSVSPQNAAATRLWSSSNSAEYAPLSLVGDYFYAMDGESAGTSFHSYYARLPKTGGTFKRIAEGGTPWNNRVVTDGTAYVADSGERTAPERSVTCALTEGKLLDPSVTRTLAHAPPWADGRFQYRADWPAWDATPTTVYLGYGDQLYRVARQF